MNPTPQLTLVGMEDTIGSRVRYWRKERGITQERLAHLSELSHSTIARLERDRIENPDLETLESIARALNIQTSDLLGGATLPTPARESAVYPSLAAFLERYVEVMAINDAERSWLESQVFQLGDIGDPEWWMALLSLYRHQVRTTSGARILLTSSAPSEPDPRSKH